MYLCSRKCGFEGKLSLGLFQGQIELRDLKLKPSALDEFKLPIEIKFGYLKSLKINIPLNPWTTPIKISIDGLYILTCPRKFEDYDVSVDSRVENSLKRKLVFILLVLFV